jgi:hypothetical protein
MIKENLRVTRGLMASLLGASTQEKIFKFHERINNLCLKDREMSFLMPTIMTYSSKNFKINFTYSSFIIFKYLIAFF